MDAHSREERAPPIGANPPRVIRVPSRSFAVPLSSRGGAPAALRERDQAANPFNRQWTPIHAKSGHSDRGEPTSGHSRPFAFIRGPFVLASRRPGGAAGTGSGRNGAKISQSGRAVPALSTAARRRCHGSGRGSGRQSFQPPMDANSREERALRSGRTHLRSFASLRVHSRFLVPASRRPGGGNGVRPLRSRARLSTFKGLGLGDWVAARRLEESVAKNEQHIESCLPSLLLRLSAVKLNEKSCSIAIVQTARIASDRIGQLVWLVTQRPRLIQRFPVRTRPSASNSIRVPRRNVSPPC
jgi:hypothetical protein